VLALQDGTMVHVRPIAPEDEQPPSQFKDGRIGWHQLPIRGQETVFKWFMDTNGQITGVTQQPWVGQLIDIPAPKFLLFRPTAHKNNPEPQRPPQRLPLLLVRKAPGGA